MLGVFVNWYEMPWHGQAFTSSALMGGDWPCCTVEHLMKLATPMLYNGIPDEGDHAHVVQWDTSQR